MQLSRRNETDVDRSIVEVFHLIGALKAGTRPEFIRIAHVHPNALRQKVGVHVRLDVVEVLGIPHNGQLQALSRGLRAEIRSPGRVKCVQQIAAEVPFVADKLGIFHRAGNRRMRTLGG